MKTTRRAQRCGADAGTLLAHALQTMSAALQVRVESIADRPWASATFVGTRHVVRLVVPSVPGVRSWLAALPEAPFSLRGHIVADLCVDAIEQVDGDVHATLTVLTLEDL